MFHRPRRAVGRDAFARVCARLVDAGVAPVVVHGGGPLIGEMLDRLGLKSEFRDGLRVTDAATLDVARMVLVGKVGRDVVAGSNVHGPLAVGISGEDGGLIRATARDPELSQTIRTLRAHGATASYMYDAIGGNFRLDALQAASSVQSSS